MEGVPNTRASPDGPGPGGRIASGIGAVEIAAAVEEDFARAVGAIDQVAAELVGGEQARARRDVGVGRDRKLVGGESPGGSDPGAFKSRTSSDDGGTEREAVQPRVEARAAGRSIRAARLPTADPPQRAA